MLKVVIVEDETFVRKGIVLATDWKKMDCVVVGDASNGEEGLKLIRRLSPDLVITDVRMPNLDGIGMIRKLIEEGCKSEIIILTAYSEFNYARSALKLGVMDYLLKPFTDAELEAGIQKAKDKILAMWENEDQIPGMLRFNLEKSSKNKYVEKAIKYIRNHYQEDISMGNTAAYIGISEGHLSRIFKKETDYTFIAYLTNYRIHTAMGLLKDCGFKVYEVADMVGYNDITYFSTLFKRMVGVNPSEYQNRS